MELCKMFTGNADMAIVHISIPPHIRGWGAVIKALPSTCSITKFTKIALTGEPIEQPNILL